MKKILLSAIAVMAFGFANAQDSETAGFSKGDFFVSGGLGFNSTKTGDFKTNNFNFSPMAAYFITENIALGGQLNVGTGKSEAGDSETKNTSLGINAIGRYYFTPGNAFSIFGQAQVGYFSNKMNPEFGEDVKTDGFNIGVGPGMNYFVSSHFALEAGLGILSYSTAKPDFDGAESTDTFNLNLNLSNVTFGVVYKF